VKKLNPEPRINAMTC